MIHVLRREVKSIETNVAEQITKQLFSNQKLISVLLYTTNEKEKREEKPNEKFWKVRVLYYLRKKIIYFRL